MRPTQLTTFLASAIAHRRPVLITGAPGIGKSDIVAQAARAAGADMILSHPVVADPTDAKGLPWPEKGGKEATFLPFGEMAAALRATTPTVWFLDDLGQAPPAVQASFMQLLLARRINGHRLPDCVTFVAATNRRTDRAGVSGILEPVKSRFVAIVELEPHLDDWCDWAFDNGVPAELIAFIRFRAELLSAFTPSADLTNCPVPRTWAHAAQVLAMGLPADLQNEALAGAVGQGAATEFTAFLRMYRDLPAIEDILDDPDGAVIPPTPATLYAVVTGLGMRTDVKVFPKIARYAHRLMAANHGEFAALLMRDAVRKDKGVMNTAAFVKVASSELGQLIASSGQ